MEGAGRVGGEPVGFTGFPEVSFGGAGLFDDFHGAAGEGDDDAGMLVAVQGERSVGEDDGLPDFDFVIFELRDALGCVPWGVSAADGSKNIVATRDVRAMSLNMSFSRVRNLQERKG